MVNNNAFNNTEFMYFIANYETKEVSEMKLTNDLAETLHKNEIPEFLNFYIDNLMQNKALKDDEGGTTFISREVFSDVPGRIAAPFKMFLQQDIGHKYGTEYIHFAPTFLYDGANDLYQITKLREKYIEYWNK